MTEQSPWGRTDEQGNVYVRLPGGGEALVGQWAAGDPAEGLAHYRRRYEDMVAEVSLTADRLQKGLAKPDAADELVARMRAALAEPKVVGDLAGLGELLTQVQAAAASSRLTLQAEGARVKAEALARREAIVAEAESLAGSTSWKAAGDRLRELMEQWKAAPRIDRATDQVLWDRFRTARSAFDRARKAHFAQLDAARATAASAKESIVEQAEALARSTDWNETRRRFDALMEQWKAAPRAGREAEQQLWTRFKRAQDTFFQSRKAQFAERDAEQDANLRTKQELLAQAEALLPIKDLGQAKQALRQIQQSWAAIGHVPRNAKESLENRMAKVVDAVGRSESDQWRRTDPAARDRAERTVAQFEEALTTHQRALAKAQESGDSGRIAKAEASVTNTEQLLEAARKVLAEFTSAG